MELKTPNQQLAHDLLEGLWDASGGRACAIVVVEEEEGGMARPFVSFRGNMTDAAQMARSIMEAAITHGRPTDCIACMENYDAMVRAIAEFYRVVGSC